AWGDITPSPGAAFSGVGPLTAVTGQGPDHAWAVGNNGQVWYCPQNCSTQPTSWVLLGPGFATGQNLQGISFVDPHHISAVGANRPVAPTPPPGSPTLDALDQAIGSLGVALNSTIWADGNHLGPNLGNQAVDNIVQAVQVLNGLPNPPGPPGPPGP